MRSLLRGTPQEPTPVIVGIQAFFSTTGGQFCGFTETSCRPRHGAFSASAGSCASFCSRPRRRTASSRCSACTGRVDAFFDSWVYNGLLVAASLACLARGFAVKAERLPWLLLGIALALWTTGDLYYFFAFSGTADVPIPSLSDPFYLAFYPVSYAALALLLRRRMQDFRGNLFLDGVIAVAGRRRARSGGRLRRGVEVDGRKHARRRHEPRLSARRRAAARARRRHVRPDRLAASTPRGRSSRSASRSSR